MDLNQHRELDPEEGSPAAVESSVSRDNQSRPRMAWRPPKLLTLALIMVVAGFIITLAYLRDEEVPWDGDLRRPIFLQQQQDVSAPARMKAMLAAAAKISSNDPAVLSPWTEDLAKVGGLLDRHGAVLDNLREIGRAHV